MNAIQKQRKHKRHNWFSIVMIAPAVIVAGGFIIYPLFLAVYMSLREKETLNFVNMPPSPLSFANYQRLLTDPKTYTAIGNSLLYMGLATLIAFLIGLALALVMNKDVWGRRFFRTTLLLPWAVPSIVVVLAFVWIEDSSYGVLNYILSRLGIIQEYIPWFASRKFAMAGVLMPTIWHSYPFYALMLLASMQSIPLELYEACHIDGGNRIQTFANITWPSIKSTAVLALVLNGLGIFKNVDYIMTTTGGGPNYATSTLAIQIYNFAFTNFKMSRASALGMITLVICLLLVCLAFSAVKERYFGGAEK